MMSFWLDFFTGDSTIENFVKFLIAFITLITLFVGSVWKIRPIILRAIISDKLSRVKQQISLDNQQSEKKKELYEDLVIIQNLIKKSESYSFKEQLEEAKQLEAKIRFKLRYHIRFFILTPSLDRQNIDQYTTLILKQNTLQSLFQFELGHIRRDKSPEQEISDLPLNDFRLYLENFERIIKNSEYEYIASKEDITRVIITDSPLPGNYYTLGNSRIHANKNNSPRQEWNGYKPYRFYIISIASMKAIFPDIPLEHFLLRVLQRICMRLVFTKSPANGQIRLRHSETRGCLFDFTENLSDLQYFIKSGFICEDCISSILEAEEIPEGFRKGFLDEFQQWLLETLPDKPIDSKKD